MATPATRALAEGRMVAGLMPGAEPSPSHWTPQATTRVGLIDEIQSFVALWGSRAPERWLLKLQSLRRQRGRLARRMARNRTKRSHVRLRSAAVRRFTRQERAS